MKKILWVLFALSVAVNGWLLFKQSPVPPAGPLVRATPTTTAIGVASASRSAPESKPAESAAAREHRAKLVQTLVTINSADVDSVRDQLRAVGADESLIYGLIDGILRIRYSEAKRAAELENI